MNARAWPAFSHGINEYLDVAKSALGCRTDDELAQRLGVSHSTISHYRHGRYCPTVHMARLIANALRINAAEVISDLRKEKARRKMELEKRSAGRRRLHQ